MYEWRFERNGTVTMESYSANHAVYDTQSTSVFENEADNVVQLPLQYLQHQDETFSASFLHDFSVRPIHFSRRKPT